MTKETKKTLPAFVYLRKLDDMQRRFTTWLRKADLFEKIRDKDLYSLDEDSDNWFYIFRLKRKKKGQRIYSIALNESIYEDEYVSVSYYGEDGEGIIDLSSIEIEDIKIDISDIYIADNRREIEEGEIRYRKGSSMRPTL